MSTTISMVTFEKLNATWLTSTAFPISHLAYSLIINKNCFQLISFVWLQFSDLTTINYFFISNYFSFYALKINKFKEKRKRVCDPVAVRKEDAKLQL